MSTELETSYGGVVVRGDELLVITPAGKKVTGLPKGGMEAGETPGQGAARGGGGGEGGAARAGRGPRGARGDGRRGQRDLPARRRSLHLSAWRAAGALDRPLLPVRIRQGLDGRPRSRGRRSTLDR